MGDRRARGADSTPEFAGDANIRSALIDGAGRRTQGLPAPATSRESIRRQNAAAALTWHGNGPGRTTGNMVGEKNA